MAAVSTSVPELWKTGVNLALPQKSRILVPGAYVNFDAQVNGPGDTVHFNEVSNLTVTDWNGSDALTYPALTVEDTSITLNNYGKLAFSITDIESKQSQLALLEGGVAKAVKALEVFYDGKALAALQAAGNAATWDEDFDVADISTGDKIVGLVADAIAAMVAAGEDRSDVRVLMSPQAIATCVKGKIFGSGSEASAAVTANGTVGVIAGATVAEVPDLSASDEDIIVYKTDALMFAQQLWNPETLRLESQPATGFRATPIYGVKVLRSTAVVRITEADDAS